MIRNLEGTEGRLSDGCNEQIVSVLCAGIVVGSESQEDVWSQGHKYYVVTFVVWNHTLPCVPVFVRGLFRKFWTFWYKNTIHVVGDPQFNRSWIWHRL